MEGFLQLRSKGGVFKSKKYDRVWCIIDGQQLTIYGDIDFTTGSCSDVKKILFLKDAIIQKIADEEFQVKHGLKIESLKSKGSTSSGSNDGGKKKQSTTLLDCKDAATCTLWYNILIKTLTLHVQDEERRLLPIQCCKVLELDVDAKRTRSMIVKAYKKLSLKLHPDRGGDPDLFNKLNQAYSSLLALQAEDDDLNNSIVVEFEAMIEKGGAGVGLGLVVMEDKVRKHVIIQGVQDNIILHGLSAEAEGAIRPGDALVGIDNDHCSHWWITRVRARLSNARIPVGTTVRLVFERRVPKDSNETNENSGNTESAPSSPVSSPAPLSASTKTSFHINTDTNADGKSANANNPIVGEGENNLATPIRSTDRVEFFGAGRESYDGQSPKADVQSQISPSSSLPSEYGSAVPVSSSQIPQDSSPRRLTPKSTRRMSSIVNNVSGSLNGSSSSSSNSNNVLFSLQETTRELEVAMAENVRLKELVLAKDNALAEAATANRFLQDSILSQEKRTAEHNEEILKLKEHIAMMTKTMENEHSNHFVSFLEQIAANKVQQQQHEEQIAVFRYLLRNRLSFPASPTTPSQNLASSSPKKERLMKSSESYKVVEDKADKIEMQLREMLGL